MKITLNEEISRIKQIMLEQTTAAQKTGGDVNKNAVQFLDNITKKIKDVALSNIKNPETNKAVGDLVNNVSQQIKNKVSDPSFNQNIENKINGLSSNLKTKIATSVKNPEAQKVVNTAIDLLAKGVQGKVQSVIDDPQKYVNQVGDKISQVVSNVEELAGEFVPFVKIFTDVIEPISYEIESLDPASPTVFTDMYNIVKKYLSEKKNEVDMTQFDIIYNAYYKNRGVVLDKILKIAGNYLKNSKVLIPIEGKEIISKAIKEELGDVGSRLVYLINDLMKNLGIQGQPISQALSSFGWKELTPQQKQDYQKVMSQKA